MYLGVDLKQLASRALEQSQLVALSLLGWETSTQKSTADPESPPLETQPSPTAKESGLINILSANDSAGSDSTSIESSNSVNTSSGLETSNQHATETVQPFEMTLAQREAVTKAYWDAVVRCIRTEIQDRRPKTPQENWQLLDYLIHRQQGPEIALKTLQQLDGQGVDARLLTHSENLLDWHRLGEELFSEAVNLLPNEPRSQLTGPFAQSWQSAATQHRMEEKLVRKKHHVTVSYLNHTYESLAPFKPAIP
ncbi:MAG: hypothetical protein MKZ95_06215 [Pirellulales bacterium]|nr:hypothetical protein [Pirellulales bacterium]